jgi:uncharacterized protein
MAAKTNRRKFFRDSALSAAGIALVGTAGGTAACSTARERTFPPFDYRTELRKYRKIDAHVHIGFRPGDLELLLDFADRLEIEKLCISRPVTNFSGNEPEGPEVVHRFNDIIIDAVRRYPDRFIGFMTLNPRFPAEAMAELERCLDAGLSGYKGYTQVKINDPLYYPIIERFAELNMVMLMHAFCQLGLGGYRMKYDIGKDPHTSIPEDFVDAARRYPEAVFQFAHIGGGGDWEYECKMLADVPNVYVDTSGSNNEEHMIEFALKHLGEDRLLFGTDNSYYQGVGKILSANLTESQKQKIFFGNFNQLLRRAGKHVA